MATSIIPKAARGQSADMPNQGAANLPGIPFDDELPGDPATNCQAERTEEYEDVRKEPTRRLVKVFRSLMNEQGDQCGSIQALCDLGIQSAAVSGSLSEEALFRAINLIRLQEGRHMYRMHGVVEALIDRLPRAGAEPNHSGQPPQREPDKTPGSDSAVLHHLWQVAMDAICGTNVQDATEGVDEVIHTLLAMKRFMPAVEG
jgi:hypothetical protein